MTVKTRLQRIIKVLRRFHAIHFVSLITLLGLSAWARPAEAIKFWAVTGAIEDVDMYRRLADQFEKESGIRVEVTSLAWGNFKTKYFAAMAAGIPPDVGLTNLGGPFDYGSVGGLLSINQDFGAEGDALIKEFNPKLMGALKIGERVYGVPGELTTLILYYRKDIYAKLGLNPPKTWSELNRQIGLLEGQGRQFYLGFTQGAQWALSLYTSPFGKRSMRIEGGVPRVDWNDPDYQKGVLQAMRMWYLHDSPGKDLGGRAIGMFAEDNPGKSIALMADISQNEAQIRSTHPEIDGKWGMAPWPTADGGKPAHVTGGTAYVIFRGTKNPKAAFAWLKFLNRLDVQQSMILDHLQRGTNSNFFMSPLASLWAPENAEFLNSKPLQPSKELIEVLRSVVNNMETFPAVFGSAEQDRAEANVLDGMASTIQGLLNDAAGSLNLTRAELIRSWGRGEHLDVRDIVEAKIAAKLKSDYSKIAGPAEAALKIELDRYETRFGDIVKNLNKYERASNALTYAKAFILLLVIAGVGAVLGVPKLRKNYRSYLFVGVPILLALVFVYVPAIVALYLSFTEYHPVLPLASAKFKGVGNYTDLASSGDLFGSLKRTALYAVATLPIGILLALLFAYQLSGKIRGSRLWRFLYFSPIVTSVVSISLIFTQLFLGSRQGWLNTLFMNLGWIKDPIQFLNSESTFLPCVMILAIWHGLAFTIMVFLAGFQQVPRELDEAASVDGASKARRFWKVSVPSIRPQVFFISVLGLIGSFQVFETIYMLSNKSGDAIARFGPGDSGMTVVPLLYHYGFETFEMGKASALAYVLFAIILILTAIQTRIYRKGDRA